MTIVHRVLYPHPITSLDEYVAKGGGEGLEAARKVEPSAPLTTTVVGSTSERFS